MKWVLAHKLMLLALAGASFDTGTTMHYLDRNRYLPPRGTLYVGTDGLERMSPGPPHDLTLGRAGNARIAFQVPDAVITTLILHRRLPKLSEAAFATEAGVNFWGGAMNLKNEQKALPRPMCVVGPGCVGGPNVRHVN